MKIEVQTDKPVALDSPDHIHPVGAANDNSVHTPFTRKLLAHFNRRFSVLDLGCAGGGFVQECLEFGILAVGIEGSDICRNTQRAAWARVPDYLFTADITHPFTVLFDGEPAKFDVVTAWDVMEHIAEPLIPQVIDNVRRHLLPGRPFLCTINSIPQGEHHQTVMPPRWWELTFHLYGLGRDENLESYFGEDHLRGRNTAQNSNSTFFALRWFYVTDNPTC